MFHKDAIKTSTDGYVASLAILKGGKKEETLGKRACTDKSIHLIELVCQTEDLQGSHSERKLSEWCKLITLPVRMETGGICSFLKNAFIITFTYLLCTRVHMCHSAHGEVRGQPVGAGFLLLP